MSHRPASKAAAVVVVVLALFAGACSDDDDPAVAPSTATVTTEKFDTSPTVSTTSTTTTSPPTTGSTTTTAAPPTTATSIAPDDWPAILTELSRRQVALYAAPDLARIGEYCMPATNCAADLEAQLGDFISRGEHVEGQQPFTVVEVEKVLAGEPSPAGEFVQIVFVAGPSALPAARIVDASGNVVDELSVTAANTRGIFNLAKWNDPVLPWRLVMAEDLGSA